MSRKVDPEKYDEKRRQILVAARECFTRDGLRGASISDICAAAHMSPGHLYHYFESKEAIVRAMVEADLEKAAPVFHELRSGKNVVEALIHELDRRLRKDRRGGASLTLDMLAESFRNPVIADVLRRREQARRGLLGGLLREGQERDQIDRSLDPDSAAAIISAIFGTLNLLKIYNSGLEMKHTADALKLLIARFLDPRDASAV